MSAQNVCTNAAVLLAINIVMKVFRLICIITPILLIVFLAIDLAQNVMASSDDVIRNNMKKIVRRCLFALGVFLCPTLVNLLFSALGNLGVSYAACIKNSQNFSDFIETQEEQENDSLENSENNSSENNSSNTEGENTSSGNSSSNAGNGNTSSGNSSSNTENGSTSSGNSSSNIGNGNTSSGNSSSNTSGNNSSGNGQSSSTKKKNTSNLENAKSYKSVKVLKTVKQSQLHKITSVSGINSCTSTQSLAIAGNYIVTANINHSDSMTILQVYNKSTGKKVNTIQDNLHHANGMTYNANNKNLYIVHNNGGKYTSFPANNISSASKISKTTKTFSKSLSGIAYDKDTKQYYLSKGSQVYVTDENFKIKRTVKKIRSLTPQDIGAYKGIIMVIVTRLNSPLYSAIDLYRASDGAYVGTYVIDLPNSELESVAYYGDNKFALLFNGNPDAVYTTSAINLK